MPVCFPATGGSRCTTAMPSTGCSPASTRPAMPTSFATRPRWPSGLPSGPGPRPWRDCCSPPRTGPTRPGRPGGPRRRSASSAASPRPTTTSPPRRSNPDPWLLGREERTRAERESFNLALAFKEMKDDILRFCQNLAVWFTSNLAERGFRMVNPPEDLGVLPEFRGRRGILRHLELPLHGPQARAEPLGGAGLGIPGQALGDPRRGPRVRLHPISLPRPAGGSSRPRPDSSRRSGWPPRWIPGRLVAAGRPRSGSLRQLDHRLQRAGSQAGSDGASSPAGPFPALDMTYLCPCPASVSDAALSAARDVAARRPLRGDRPDNNTQRVAVTSTFITGLNGTYR
jgi:hypothetical protein